MKKNEMVVLAKKRNGRSVNFNYRYLYLDKTSNILTSSKVFHTCEEIMTVDNNEIMTIEDFDFNNINTALLSFYYEELREVEIKEDVLAHLLRSLYINYENDTLQGYNEDLLKDNEEEVTKIWNLVTKWYNEDKK